MRVTWSDPAVADLEKLRTYIGDQSPRAARRVAHRILVEVRRLSRFPAAGRPGRVAETRELVVVGTPYLVPYRVRGETIQILRVLHGAQRWPESPSERGGR